MPAESVIVGGRNKRSFMKTCDAFKVVAAALRKDKGYYIAWQSNIAMAFVDTARQQGSRDSYKKLHKVANDAATYFMDLLITPVRPQKKRSRQAHPPTAVLRKGKPHGKATS